jgi:hypothetical protein
LYNVSYLDETQYMTLIFHNRLGRYDHPKQCFEVSFIDLHIVLRTFTRTRVIFQKFDSVYLTRIIRFIEEKCQSKLNQYGSFCSHTNVY